MPNPTPTPAPALGALPEEIRDALENSALASFHCGGWREGDEEPFKVVYERAEDFKARLVAAITAALSQGAADAARLDALERYATEYVETGGFGPIVELEMADEWEDGEPDREWTVIGQRESPAVTRLGHGPTLRDAIDDARSTLDAAHAGGTHG